MQTVLAKRVEVNAETLSVDLVDGRTMSVPLSWFPRLQQAGSAELQNCRLMQGGRGIRFPSIDEDIRVESLLTGETAPTRSPTNNRPPARRSKTPRGRKRAKS